MRVRSRIITYEGMPRGRTTYDIELDLKDQRRQRGPYDNELKTIHLDVLEDMRRQRRRVLAWAMWTTSLLLLLTAVFIGWHMWATHGLADVKLLMAWIASVLAASIGIIASISKFLFAETVKAIQPLRKTNG